MKSQFFLDVYAIVDRIPYGKVTTYGAIANALGSKKSARLVGYAMNESHITNPDIPAHRVVNRVGLLTGRFHFGTGDEMQKLLEGEGHIVKNNKIENFDKIFWDPLIHLNLE